MSDSHTQVAGLQVASELYQFVNQELLPDLNLNPEKFWADAAHIVTELAPKNKALLAERSRLQAELDTWHQANPGPVRDMAAYGSFLEKIGYLVPVPESVRITTENADLEVTSVAGPQLVVPLLNARYALNAANARWDSLYDALYGTDIIPEDAGLEKGRAYNPRRGAKVIEWARQELDRNVPLASGSHVGSKAYQIENGALVVTLANGERSGLKDPAQLVGYLGDPQAPSRIALQHHKLYLEIYVEPDSLIGKEDAAGVSDIIVESALSTILDLEDSVAAVDAEDKVLGYRNWLGIMRGSLSEEFEKNGETITRKLNADRVYKTPDGQGQTTLRGRALLFIRNVGHLMTNPAVLYRDADGQQQEIPEGILDAIITITAAVYDLRGLTENGIRNSRTGSVYIVKPKMHGPAEVAFTNELFGRVEQMLDLPPNTVKLGIMDEERRTSVNLKACIAAAKARIAFINTGFLDRTGDEMHTSTQGGPMYRKGDMKSSAWIAAYERNNVMVGLDCGMHGKAQIGKGMWAKPDLMSAMLAEKIAHPRAGGNTAWVPSPTAATIHALHYHRVDVKAVQEALLKELAGSDPKALRDELLSGLLSAPIVTEAKWTAEERQQELENNCQGILGYVVRWIELGIGCSKVPDIHGIQLMEDRATLRISSQHIANWLLHGVITREQVESTLLRMAVLVDEQNSNTEGYRRMQDKPQESAAFQAASDLIFKGLEQPSGYTEPLLHAWRQKVKAGEAS